MNWVRNLQERWKLKSAFQVILILIAFACTGFTVLFLKRPIVSFFTSDGEQNIWFSVIYYILIFPIYNVILLIYGLLLGQFKFFWEFEKKTFRKLTGKKEDA